MLIIVATNIKVVKEFSRWDVQRFQRIVNKTWRKKTPKLFRKL